MKQTTPGPSFRRCAVPPFGRTGRIRSLRPWPSCRRTCRVVRYASSSFASSSYRYASIGVVGWIAQNDQHRGVLLDPLGVRSRPPQFREGRGFWTVGSQPVSALVRNTPARSAPSSDSGASRSCIVSPTCRWATTKGAGMISNPKTRSVAACFTFAPASAPEPCAPPGWLRCVRRTSAR